VKGNKSDAGLLELSARVFRTCDAGK